MSRTVAQLSRRAGLALPTLSLPMLALLPRAARGAPPPIVDAIGRIVALKALPERIALGFNYEEFTAVAGPAGWDRVAGMSKAPWQGWRPSSFRRYAVPIPRLAAMPDIGNTEDGNFNLEALLALRPDLLILAEWSYAALGEMVGRIEALGIPVMVIDHNAQIPARHVASTIALGAATGNEERARALAATYMAKLADIQRRAAAAGSISANSAG